MDENAAKIIASAILKLAEEVHYLADNLSADEPLSYSVARGLHKIAEAIETK